VFNVRLIFIRPHLVRGLSLALFSSNAPQLWQMQEEEKGDREGDNDDRSSLQF